MNECPMTLVGKKLLEAELDQLIKVEREQIKVAISEARDLGDLKENAEYHAAKEKQSHIEGRIMELQAKLARARVVDVSTINSERVIFGATVEVYDQQKDTTVTFQIVGEDEAMSGGNKISYNSPLGKALIGKEVGDEAIVKAPKGDLVYEIQDIRYS
ncbi:MAG TPA: transcription elongation factor GreA [Bacteriovoracaceae bacterium]|nr:transcription elongation factor GreA [Bacteriovoracaceae bacterium]